MSKNNNYNSADNHKKQGKPVKKVHLDLEQTMSKEEIGNYLVDIGQKLINEGSFTIVQGQESYEINPSGHLELEIQYKTKGEKNTFEIEIQWKPGVDQSFEIT